MRMQAKLFAIVLCSLAVFACGGDDDPSTVNGVVYSWEESTVPITVAGVSVRAFGTDISETCRPGTFF